jgi:UDP-N-acetylglucosamine--N-acetylmuramyl-(pentapeptide) pyrophosphoryl-undecaprenol N-acetylglucosamine transferase
VRLLICAGGTGGGVYPALAVLKALEAWFDCHYPAPQTAEEALTVLWVGSEGGMEADLVQRTGIDFTTIAAAGVHGVSARTLPGNLWKLGCGYLQARRILGRFQPDVMLFTGGYVGAPVALAGRKLPSVLVVPDIEPGQALNALARFATQIALTAPDSAAYFPKHQNLTVTGYPTRPELQSWDPETARQHLNLTADLPTLLIFGGSKGAQSINQALLPVLAQLLAEAQIIHITGQTGWDEIETHRAGLAENLGEELASHYHAYPYLHDDMGAALSVADLAVARAGASTLGELPLFGLPAILVPYPYAWRYQQVNAGYLERHGAAIIIADGDLPTRLLPEVTALLRQRERLEAMRQAMSALAHPDAADAIATLCRNAAQKEAAL